MKGNAHAYVAGYIDGYDSRDNDIVRCLDCRFSNQETHGIRDELVCWRFSVGRVVNESGYCSWGIRRENAD